MKVRGRYLCSCAGIVMVLSMRVSAGTFYVAEDGDNGNGGTDWTDALATIGAGVAKATANGDVVLVSNGTYTLGAEILVTTGITVRSWNGGTLDPAGTIVDGNYQTRCFRLTHPSALLAGFTVRNGTNATTGGGIYVSGGGTVSNCIVSGNRALEGGGLCITNGGLVTHSTLSGNVAVSNATLASRGGGAILWRYGVVNTCVVLDNSVASRVAGTSGRNSGGGGIALDVDATNHELRVYGTLVSNNVSDRQGGGIHFRQHLGGLTQAVISGSTVANNTAGYQGGGICRGSISDTWLMGTVTGCVVKGNYAGGTAENGGGIFEMTLVRNCTISGNSTPGHAGGCMNVRIYDSTVESNYCQGSGGGLYLSKLLVAVSNCVIRGNSAVNGYNNGVGGIYIYNRTITEIKNCDIRGNVANKSAGGVFVYTGTTGHLYNCTIAENVVTNPSDAQCGGVGGTYGALQMSACTVVSNRSANGNYASGVYIGYGSMSNCLVYSNMAGTSFGRDIWCVGPNSSNIVFYSCAPANLPASQGNLFDAPTFANFAVGDYRAAGASPTVNAGTNEAWMDGARDLEGRPRLDPFAQRVDMGAYELLPAGVLFKLK